MQTHKNRPPERKHAYKIFTHTFVFTYIHIHKPIHTYKDKEINTKNNLQRSF